MLFYKEFKKGQSYQNFSKSIHRNVSITLDDNILTIEIPLTSSEYIFYKLEKNAIEITNDQRIFYNQQSDFSIKGIYATLQFGTLIPPYALLEGVSVFHPGFVHKVNLNTLIILKEIQWVWSKPEPQDINMDLKHQKSILKKAIDDVILRDTNNKEKQPILLFSGGIDSSILAQRISVLGFECPVLLHYSFGEGDRETRYSKEIAGKLNLPIREVYETKDDLDLLNKIGEYYITPISDPTHMISDNLCEAIIDNYDPDKYVVFNGDGIDSLFFSENFFMVANRIHKLPKWFGWLSKLAYKKFYLYKKTSVLEKYLKVVNKSVNNDFIGFSFAQNPLASILYHVDKEIITDVSDEITNWMNEVYYYDHPINRTNLGYLIFEETGCISYKTKSAVQKFDFEFSAPFQDMAFVDLSLQHMKYWKGAVKYKYPFKQLLFDDLDSKYFNRSKIAFNADLIKKFSQKSILSCLEEILEGDFKFYDMLDKNRLKQLYLHCKKRQKIPPQSYHFLWTTIFLFKWLTGVPAVSQSLKEEIEHRTSSAK